MIEAIIFDFDGVIIDTETPDYVTWQEVYSSYGVELNFSLWSQYIGGGLGDFDAYQHLEELTGKRVDRDSIREPRRKKFLTMINASPVLPGVKEYISEAKRVGLMLGVASSSSRDWVEGHLEARGLLQHFDAIRTREDVAQVKPHPELYLASVAALGTTPGRAIAIEDSANGVTAARLAGLFCVVVPNPMTRALPMGHADLHLRSLAQVPLESLLAQASSRLNGSHGPENRA